MHHAMQTNKKVPNNRNTLNENIKEASNQLWKGKNHSYQWLPKKVAISSQWVPWLKQQNLWRPAERRKCQRRSWWDQQPGSCQPHPDLQWCHWKKGGYSVNRLHHGNTKGRALCQYIYIYKLHHYYETQCHCPKTQRLDHDKEVSEDLV